MKAMADEIPAVYEDIGPKSTFFQIHADYWGLVKKYLNGNEKHIRDDAYWENVVRDAGDFAKKFDCSYARNLVLGFLDELDRRSRIERKNHEISVS